MKDALCKFSIDTSEFLKRRIRKEARKTSTPLVMCAIKREMSKTKKTLLAIDQSNLMELVMSFLQKGEYALSLLSDFSNFEGSFLLDKPEILILEDSKRIVDLEQLIEFVLANSETVKIFLLTNYRPRKWYEESLNNGIAGLIHIQDLSADLDQIISSSSTIQPFVSKEIDEILHLYTDKNEKIDLLTDSEKIILNMIALNYTTPEIAKRLFVSLKTVEKHRSNMIKKLELSGKTNSLLLWVKENISYRKD